MVDHIGNKLATAAEGIVSLSLSEAEEAAYPYAVYTLVPELHRTKDGVYKVTADVTATVYAQDYAAARDIAERFGAAVEKEFAATGYSERLSSYEERCEDGIWALALDFKMTEFV